MRPVDRRQFDRTVARSPGKVYEPRGRRYLAARTINVSASGALVELDRPLDLHPGDELMLGLARRHEPGFIRLENFIDATVVRSLGSTSGRTIIGVHFQMISPTVTNAVVRAA